MLLVEHLIAGAAAAQALMVGAIASTAFILFISPHRPAAMPRRVLGGHIWAIVIAVVASLLAASGLLRSAPVDSLPDLFPLLAALTVGLAMLAMAATNTEHAPAAGLNWELILFIAISVLILAGIHALVHRRMIDLY